MRHPNVLRSLRLALFSSIAVFNSACLHAPPVHHEPQLHELEEENDGEADEAAAYRAKTLRDERGVIRSDGLIRAHQHVKEMRAMADSSRASIQTLAGGTTWDWMGPGNIGGRIRALVIHPDNPDVMFAGSVSGGLWKTTNGGAWWTPVDDFLANLSISSIVIDPTSPSTMYAGTGEVFFAADALQGAGIFKSTDGGSTWNQLPATAALQFHYVNRLAISPDGRVLLAALQGGIARSTDGGGTFTILPVHFPLDVDFHPTNSSLAVASGIEGAAWFSTDGGVTWTAATGLPGRPGFVERVEIAYAPANPSIVYASVNNNQGELYRSTDGGARFQRAGGISGYLNVQGDYDHALWVNPVDPNDVVLGGVQLFRTTDGGATEEMLWTAGVHVDFHAVVAPHSFDSGSHSTLFITNDGGVYKLELPPPGGTPQWTSLNNDLGVTQFYGAAGDAGTGLIVGGTQDNRTLVSRRGSGTESWVRNLSSDGGFSAIDPSDGAMFYGETPRLKIFRIETSGIHDERDITFNLPDAGVRGEFVAPFILDPNQPIRMFAGGRSLWRSDDVRNPANPTWTSLYTNPIDLTAIAVAVGNSNDVWFGDGDGAVYRTDNGLSAAPTWVRVDAALPNRFVTRISIDPTDQNIVYMSFGGFSPDNIYRTNDGGSTWTDATGSGLSGLPDAPVRDVEIDPLNPASIWAATEVGIFHSTDRGATWELPHDGPANVSVDELFLMGRKLGAATHGRGVFLTDLSAAPLFTMSTSALSFGSRTVGSLSETQTVTVSNSGSAAMTVSAGAIQGNNSGDFVRTTDGCTGRAVPAGGSCALTFAFRPSAAGSRSAYVDIASSTPDSPHRLSLSGTGTDGSGDGSVAVSWTNRIHVDVDGAGITKTSGCDGCPDAGAISDQAVTGDGGYLEFYPQAGGRFYAGLGSDTSASTDPAAIEYAFSFWPQGTWEVREKGVYRTEGTFTQGDVFRISIASGAVTYFRNGTLVYTSTIGPVLPLRADITMYSLNARIENVRLKAATGSPPPPPPLPSPWNANDIGNVGVTGGSSYSSGTFSVSGAGADVWGTADAFQFAYQPLTGDGTIVARVATVQPVAPWTKAGVMIRQSLTPSASHAFMVVSSGKGLAFQRRTAAGGLSTSTSGIAGVAPRWVRVARAGNTVTASYSSDGSNWTTAGQDTIPLGATAYVGLAVSSHDATRTATATFDQVAVTTTAPPPPPLPPGWATSDVGAVGVAGSASADAGTFTVAGAGADIWGTADAFRYAYYTLPADGSIVARVASIENVAPWTKAGVMLRQSLAAESAQALMLVSAGKGLAFQRRTAAGALSTSTSGGTGVAPRWVKLVRAGQSVSAYAGPDGVSWTLVGQDTIAFSGAVWAGLAVSSHDTTRTATARFDNVAVVQATTLPTGWQSVDIGSVGARGSATATSGTFTVKGAGADVWGSADAFHYAYTTLPGDGDVVARVVSVENVAPWTKAGVMIRGSLSASAPHAFMLVSSGKGLAFQRRVMDSGTSTNTAGGAGTAPTWVRLVRAGTSITAYTSTDGASWTMVGHDAFPMTGAVYVGLAVSSHDPSRTATATLDSVSVK